MRKTLYQFVASDCPRDEEALTRQCEASNAEKVDSDQDVDEYPLFIPYEPISRAVAIPQLQVVYQAKERINCS